MVEFNSYKLLSESVNKTITIKGKISTIIWQRIVGTFEQYPFSEYFDLEDDFQTVIYSKDKIEIRKVIEIVGKVVEIKSNSKKVAGENDEYVEYHIVVERYKIVE